MEIQCLVSGKVQGVRYRDYVQAAANELGLVGYVRNNPDGTVSICAQGEPEKLRLLVEYLHEGSLQARVETVSIDWVTAKKLRDDFSIRYD